MSAQYLIPIDDQRPALSFWADIIEAHSAPDDIVLVPFAKAARIARAALERGRRVILLVRTPAQQLRLWSRLAPISDADKRRALGRLATTTKRDVPLDLHINSLYQTACPGCGEAMPATAFIWDAEGQVLFEKELSCQACGFHGRAPADERDTAQAARFERRGLGYWFILEWLVDAQDASGREIARRRLDRYHPRSLTALADVTRKIDAELADDPPSQRILRFCLLHALDAGRLQPDSAEGREARPAASSAERAPEEPGVVERNIWHLLTRAPAADETSTPLRVAQNLETFFGESEPLPSVAVAAGPIRRLARQLPANRIALMLGAPPALDIDNWIWEQLWTRWLFGRGGAGGLQPPVGGWTRHVRALEATVAALVPALHAEAHVFFRFDDHDPDRSAAALMAMARHAALDDFVYQPRLVQPARLFGTAGGTYHITFRLASMAPLGPRPAQPMLAEAVEKTAVDSAVNLLGIRAEPLPFDWLFMAAAVRLARSELLRQIMAALDIEMSPLAFVKQHVRQGLRSALAEGLLVAVAGDDATHWWLPETPPAEPLAERLETTVIGLLNREPPLTPADVYRRFPGWLTPEAELLQALLTAYGEEVVPGQWIARGDDPGEWPAIYEAAQRLGQRLGFSVGGGIADVVWGEEGHATHAFRIARTGRWRDLGIDVLPESVAGYVVLPDRLAHLLRIKLVRNPLLRRELIDRGWSLVKAGHLLTLADSPEANRQEFKKIVGLDPIIEQDEAQIPLF